jgi:hypothetical protein
MIPLNKQAVNPESVASPFAGAIGENTAGATDGLASAFSQGRREGEELPRP